VTITMYLEKDALKRIQPWNRNEKLMVQNQRIYLFIYFNYYSLAILVLPFVQIKGVAKGCGVELIEM
jgi:hypothetical protein